MFMYTDYTQHLLDNVKKIHFIGCGGSGMYPLIQILSAKGYDISGSDVLDGSIIRSEREMGVKVTLGHSADNVVGADLVVYSAAIAKDNVELNAAASYGITTVERSVLLGYVSRLYKQSICVSGTHGKTTTTSMMTHILMEAKMDPTVMIGGYLPLLHAGHRVGKGDTIVLESCEYCDSFLNFFPTLAVVLNVEADHLDYFKDLADIQKSFHKFAEMATFGVASNGDDPHTVEAMKGIKHISFGLGEQNQVRAENISPDWRHFDVAVNGEIYCHVDMGVMGRHNAMNTLGAAAAAWMLGIPGEAVTKGVAAFHGAGRRMEHKGTFNGAEIYDDYAHHPDELRATLETARGMKPRRLVVAFQPHTYSRTKALFDDFVRELSKPDVLVLAEIYAARERNTYGVSSMDLAARIPGAVYCATLPEVTDYLRRNIQPGDLVLTIGAGDIFRAGEALFKD